MSSSVNKTVYLSPDKAETFARLQQEGKQYALEGYLQESLECFIKAKAIYPSGKVLSRIERLEAAIKNSAQDEEKNGGGGDEMVEVADGFYLYHEVYNKLFPYQRDGVAWMWKLYKSNKGGVLGDDMGLGKTFQVIAFLSGMIDAKLVKNALIIMPVSLLPNWKNEFQKWCPGIMVREFHGTSKKEREQNLNRVQRHGGVVLTSYGMVIGNCNIISALDGRPFIWDYVILDEGHKIKNPTKTTKAVHEIPSKNRLVLTGTPVQNNLQELWALYDFAHQGTLLGSRRTFKLSYETPITRAREKDASRGERELGTHMAESLKKLIEPYFLRRTKDILDQEWKPRTDPVEELSTEMDQLRLSSLSKKNDFIVWLYLSDAQYKIYTEFLESETVKRILTDKRSPLVQLTILKKICDHPRLLRHRTCLQLGLNGEMSEEELNRVIEDESSASVSIENVSDKTLMQESGKLEFAIKLLENLRDTGHRTLVFSLSRKILDMIQRILVNKQWKVLRIDGTVTKMEDRAKRIQLFQRNSSYPVFLLTTQVGGVGITLTAADRVIIYDPSWNPATDAQAVDRVYRIGQRKNVVVYRLITCGSIEEKIYRRQIFKDSITRQATGSSKDPFRYFTKQELRELFTVDDIHYSPTQVQLSEMHARERKSDTSLDEHIAFLHTLNIFGISDHDLMFTKNIKDDGEDNDKETVSHENIKRRVEEAQQCVQREAYVIEEGLKQSGAFMKPFVLPIPVSTKKTLPDYYQAPKFPQEIDHDLKHFGEKGDIKIKSPFSKETLECTRPGISSLQSPHPKDSGQKNSVAHPLFHSPDAESLGQSENSGSPTSPKNTREASLCNINKSPMPETKSSSIELIDLSSPCSEVEKQKNRASGNRRATVSPPKYADAHSSILSPFTPSAQKLKSIEHSNGVNNASLLDVKKTSSSEVKHASSYKLIDISTSLEDGESDEEPSGHARQQSNEDEQEDCLACAGPENAPVKFTPKASTSHGMHTSDISPFRSPEHEAKSDSNLLCSEGVSTGSTSSRCKSFLSSTAIPEIERLSSDQRAGMSSYSERSQKQFSPELGNNSILETTSPIPKTSGVNMAKIKILGDSFDDVSTFSENKRLGKGGRLSRRQSCANPRRSTVMLSESDTSSPKTDSSTQVSDEIIVSESEESSKNQDSSDPEGSLEETDEMIGDTPFNTPFSQKTCVSRIPDRSVSEKVTSEHGECQADEHKINHHHEYSQNNDVAEDRSSSLTALYPEKPSNSAVSALERNGYEILQCSPKRITPLRVLEEKPSPHKTPFEKALEASIELPHAPVTPQKGDRTISFEDSPVHVTKKSAAARKIIRSDSETSSDDDDDDQLSKPAGNSSSHAFFGQYANQSVQAEQEDYSGEKSDASSDESDASSSGLSGKGNESESSAYADDNALGHTVSKLPSDHHTYSSDSSSDSHNGL